MPLDHGAVHTDVAEALELKAELVTEVPVETARAWLEAQGVTGDA